MKKILLYTTIGLLSLTCADESQGSLLGFKKALPNIHSTDVLVDYDADTDAFTALGSAAQLLLESGTKHTIENGVFQLNLRVGETGNLLSGGPGLLITGKISALGYDGVLLSGTIDRFGFTDPPSNAEDLFDFTFTNVGGLLAALYTTSTAVIIIDPGNDSTFDGTFTSDFTNVSPPIGYHRFGFGTSDTFVTPEPASGAIWLLALGVIGCCRHGRGRSKLLGDLLP